MAEHSVDQIFNSDENRDYLQGKENLYDYQFKPTTLGLLKMNLKDRLYTNTCSEFNTYSQSDDKKSVFNGGKRVSFILNPVPFACIERIKYIFSITNNNSVAYTYTNVFSLIKSFKIFVNNKQIEEIPAEVIQLHNLLKIRSTNMPAMATSFNASGNGSLAAGATISFVLEIPSFLYNRGYHFNALGDIKVDVQFNADTTTSNIDNIILSRSEILVQYQKVPPKIDAEMRRVKSFGGPYLQVDFSSYDYANVSATKPFNIKITQTGVCPFIMFYVQTKDNASSLSTQFQANQIAIDSFRLIGPNNQGLMNNVEIDPVLNNCVNARHFKDVALITNNLSSQSIFVNNMLIRNLQVLNFCLNPKLAFKGDYVGGQLITDNDYELEINSSVDISYARVGVFLFKYQVANIKDKIVTFLER